MEEPPGARERELRLVARQALEHWPSSGVLAVRAFCRRCQAERDCLSWTGCAWAVGLDRGGTPRIGDQGMASQEAFSREPGSPLAQGNRRSRLDLVDGRVQGSAFCSVCCARLLARWDIRQRRIVSAAAVPVGTPGLGAAKHDLSAHTGCPHCGAVTSVWALVRWSGLADLAAVGRMDAEVQRWDAQRFAPAVWIENGTSYDADSCCDRCTRHVALAWRYRQGRLVVAVPLADQSMAAREDRLLVERERAQEPLLRHIFGPLSRRRARLQPEGGAARG